MHVTIWWQHQHALSALRRPATRRVLQHVYHADMAIPLPDDVRALFDAPNYVHLSTLRADGSPRNWVVWVGVEGDHLLICTGNTTWKARDMSRDPRVGISVTDLRDALTSAILASAVAYGWRRVADVNAEDSERIGYTPSTIAQRQVPSAAASRAIRAGIGPYPSRYPGASPSASRVSSGRVTSTWTGASRGARESLPASRSTRASARRWSAVRSSPGTAASRAADSRPARARAAATAGSSAHNSLIPSAAGVKKIVRPSSSAIYGAWANNPVPLTEDAPLRPSPSYLPAIVDAECERLLERAMTQQGLSARAHDRILKVARTIADLEGTTELEPKHIAEAIQYRTLDRTYWA